MNNNRLNFKETCIRYMRKEYFKSMKNNDISVTDSAYSWCKNNFLHLYLVFLPSRFGHDYLFYVCNATNNEDSLSIKNTFMLRKRLPYSIAEGSAENTTKKLIVRKIIKRPKHLLRIPIKKMLFFGLSKAGSEIRSLELGSSLKELLKNISNYMFYWELDHNDDKYKQINNMNLYLSPNSFFERTFRFRNVISGINSKQFKDELEECLFAYDNKKWFICATSIGSILEGLMFNIININRDYYENKYNNGKKGKYNSQEFKASKSSYNRIIKHQHATAIDYKNVFKASPINATDRAMRLIQALFLLRNAVDHYNSGRTNRNLCDLLLHGITDMYNDYYIRMMSFHDKYMRKH